MSDKPSSLNRRAFLGKFLPKRAEDADGCTETEDQSDASSTIGRRRALAWARNALIVAIGVLGASDAMAFRNFRFKYLNFLLPKDDNFAVTSLRHEVVPSELQPFLYQCDGVSTKDKTPEGLDIPSPSLAFEIMKSIQAKIIALKESGLQRRKDLVQLRMKILKNKSYDGDEAFQAEFKRLQNFYTTNMEVNMLYRRVWGLLDHKAGQLRDQIRDAAINEEAVGGILMRCAAEQSNVSPADIADKLDVARAPDYELANHSKETEDIEPYQCATVDADDLGQTSSVLYQEIVLLEKVVDEHIKMAIRREESFIDIKVLAGREGDAIRKAALEAAYANARTNNKIALDSWKAALVDVRKFKKILGKQIPKLSLEADLLKRCSTGEV